MSAIVGFWEGFWVGVLACSIGGVLVTEAIQLYIAYRERKRFQRACKRYGISTAMLYSAMEDTPWVE